MRESERSQILAENPKIDRKRLEEAEQKLDELRRAGILVDAPTYALDPPLGVSQAIRPGPLRCESQLMPDEKDGT